MTLLGWVIDGDNGDVGAQQPIVAIAVGRGLELKLQRIGHLQWRDGRRRRGPMQEVHDVGARGDLFIERHSAGLGNGLQAVEVS
jgi:hypothetical protein